nr:AlpA family transcriptional regulator [uncultured Undibacterium sp.]
MEQKPVILRLPQILARTGISRSSVYSFIKAGTFPKPISLGARAIGFLSSDIDDWIASRIKASRKSA